MKHGLLAFVPIFVLLVMGIQTSSSQTVVSKFGLSGWVDENGVELTWRQTNATKGSLYTIYRSDDTTLTDFVKIDSTADTMYIDTPTALVGKNLLQFYLVRAVGQRGVDSGKVLSSNVIVVTIVGIPPVGSYLLGASPEPKGKVLLEWTNPPTTVQGKYFIWRKPDTAGAVFVSAIDSTTDTTYLDTPPVVLGRTNSFVYQISVSSSGGSALRSSPASISFYVPIVKDTLISAVTPVLVGEAGKLYTFNPMVTSTDTSAKLEYSLTVNPTGMKVDSVTGTITWTPSTRGWYSVEILVTSTKHGVLRIAYNITVASGNGIIQGTVKDTASNGIRNVEVIAYQRDGVRHLRYFTKTDSSGSYRLNFLDPGNYILQAVPFNPKFVGSWYNNSSLSTKCHRTDSR